MKNLRYTIILLLVLVSVISSLKYLENKKSQNKILGNFEISSRLQDVALAHGKLQSFEILKDTIGYRHIKAIFTRDKILTNDEIELSVLYAFKEQIYHGDEIPISQNDNILLEAQFFLDNNVVNSKKYRTIKYIVFKNRKGKISYNKSLDIIDCQKHNKNFLKNKCSYLISTSQMDNKSSKIDNQKLIDTYRQNGIIIWNIKNFVSSKKVDISNAIFKDLKFMFRFNKKRNKILSLLNFTQINEIVNSRIERITMKMKNQNNVENEKIDSLKNTLTQAISSETDIIDLLCAEIYSIYKPILAQINNHSEFKGNVNTYPYSRLPLFTNSKFITTQCYQDFTGLYKITTSLDKPLELKVDSLLNSKIMYNLTKNFDYNSELTVYWDSIAPYYLKENIRITDDNYKLAKRVYIERIN